MFLKKMELLEMLDKLACFVQRTKCPKKRQLYFTAMADINELIQADCEA